MLRRDEARIILISGHGGIGKTALAAHFCDSLEKAGFCLNPAEENPETEEELPIHAILYVGERDLEQFSLTQLFRNFLQTLDPDTRERLRPVLLPSAERGPDAGMAMAALGPEEMRERPNPVAKVIAGTRRLLDALPDGLTLLLLDNFETMLDDQGIRDPELRAFLETVSRTPCRLKILITSRANVKLNAFEGLAEPLTLREGLEGTHAVEYLRTIGHGTQQIKEASDEELSALAQKVHGMAIDLRILIGLMARFAGPAAAVGRNRAAYRGRRLRLRRPRAECH